MAYARQRIPTVKSQIPKFELTWEIATMECSILNCVLQKLIRVVRDCGEESDSRRVLRWVRQIPIVERDEVSVQNEGDSS